MLLGFITLVSSGEQFPIEKRAVIGRNQDCNIRIAPSFPEVADINSAMEVFVVCVKLAAVRNKLA